VARVAAVDRLPGGRFGVKLESAAGGARLAGGNGSNVPAADVTELTADGVVLAVPAAQGARLAGPVGVASAGRWDELGYSPIVNVHVSTTGRSPACRSQRPLSRRSSGCSTRPGRLASRPGSTLAVSLSAADSYVDVPAASLREQFLPALEQLFPAAAGAGIADFFVTRERRATFRQAPGIGAIRPAPRPRCPGSCWPERGPTPAGRTRWRVPCEVRAGGGKADQRADRPAGHGNDQLAGRQAAWSCKVGRDRPSGPRPGGVVTATIPAGVETARDPRRAWIEAAVARLSPDIRRWRATTSGSSTATDAAPAVRPAGRRCGRP